jgi:hypothetical protein
MKEKKNLNEMMVTVTNRNRELGKQQDHDNDKQHVRLDAGQRTNERVSDREDVAK